MYKIEMKNVQSNEMPKCNGAYIQVITPQYDEDFIVRKIILKAGGSMPNHTNEIQHQQVVLSGEAEVVVGDEVIRAKAGDFLYIPAGVNHCYSAIYGVDYEFLCMITTAPDKITLVE